MCFEYVLIYIFPYGRRYLSCFSAATHRVLSEEYFYGVALLCEVNAGSFYWWKLGSDAVAKLPCRLSSVCLRYPFAGCVPHSLLYLISLTT